MTQPTDAPTVILERRFDAPRELIWEMWTDPVHFSAWYGPTGATITVTHMDLRVGGSRRIAMHMQTPRGPMQMWFSGEHLVIDAPTRLEYTEQVTDEAGVALDAETLGFPPGHPTLTRIIVELDDDAGGTRMTMRHVGIPPGSPGEAGWTMAFDKLSPLVQQVWQPADAVS